MLAVVENEKARRGRKTMQLRWMSEDELPTKPSGIGPSGRYNHAMVRTSHYVVVLGGRNLNADGFEDTIYVLRIDNLEWCRVR